MESQIKIVIAARIDYTARLSALKETTAKFEN
jgi:hypothetical protein